ncbi:hypothetical protein [Ulvibacterium sp.]|uniref:hypothetical protein n=1 Tax=Ulvibacterium sp. TaxID=2665914 RepID=UPI00262969EE|nr:hypothetical protein [Ulvibacterium sp.]
MTRVICIFLVIFFGLFSISLQARTKSIGISSVIKLENVKISNSNGEVLYKTMEQGEVNTRRNGWVFGGPCELRFMLYYKVEKGVEWVKIEHEKFKVEINDILDGEKRRRYYIYEEYFIKGTWKNVLGSTNVNNKECIPNSDAWKYRTVDTSKIRTIGDIIETVSNSEIENNNIRNKANDRELDDIRDEWTGIFGGTVTQKGLKPNFLANSDKLKLHILKKDDGPIGNYGYSASTYSIYILLPNSFKELSNLRISSNSMSFSRSRKHPYEFELSKETDSNGGTIIRGYFRYYQVLDNGRLSKVVDFHRIYVY